MAVAGVLATLLAPASSAPAGLFVGGTNVIGAVPIGSIEVNEAGPGGVSSMSFSIDDPTAARSISVGQEVRFWNQLTNRPTFLGYVTTPSSISDFGAQGRSIPVIATGVEAILDWSIVPAATWDMATFGWQTYQVIQGLCGLATWGAPGVQWRADPASFTRGSQAFPLSYFEGAFPLPLTPFTTPAGTLRAAIQAVCDQSSASMIGSHDGSRFFVTIDFWMGLRGWVGVTPDDVPTDYANMTIGAPDSGRHTIDGSGVIRTVVVQGGNAAGSGPVTDGTGLPGQVVSLVDATILTASDKVGRALAVLAGNAASVNGTADQLDFAPTTDVRVGSRLSLTSANTGATGSYTIMSIRKRFNDSGREDWTVGYGALPPSAATLLRRLTRDTLD